MKKRLLQMVCMLILCSSMAYAGIGDDIRRGVSLPEVMGSALKAGKSIEAVVTEAIDAGANPIEVVETALILRGDLAPLIANVAVKLRPGLAVAVLRVALGIPRVDSASVLTAIATAVSGDAEAVTKLRLAALDAGIPQGVVDQAVGAALGAPAGPVPTTPAEVGTGQRGGLGGGSGLGQGPVESPWR